MILETTVTVLLVIASGVLGYSLPRKQKVTAEDVITSITKYFAGVDSLKLKLTDKQKIVIESKRIKLLLSVESKFQ